jgi:hypothetical protein
MNRTTSDKYGGLNNSAKPAGNRRRTGTKSTTGLGRAGTALAADASSVARILRASSARPWRASQSGLSGT